MFEFDRTQRLRSRKKIETLFKQGKGFLIFPISVRYCVREGEGKVGVLITCPKRYHKLAVNRNRVKRLLRENYRLNSEQIRQFAKQQNLSIDFSMTYVDKQVPSFEKIQETVLQILERLHLEIDTAQNKTDNEDKEN